MKKLLITILMILMVFTFTACEDEGLLVVNNINDLQGKNIGVVTGTLNEDIVYEKFPTSKAVFLNTIADAIEALNNGKIDGFIMDDSAALCITLDNPEITCLETSLSNEEYGFAFPKTEEGAKLRDQMNAFIRKCKNNGTLDGLVQKWIYEDYKVAVDLSEKIKLTGKKGTITFVVDAVQKPPMAFLRNDKIVGYDIDLVTMFCKEYGYQLQVEDMTTDAMFSAIESGKADFAGSGINLTDERKTEFNYSNAYYFGTTYMVVRDASVVKSTNFFVNIKDSFIAAFVTENRWAMYIDGIGVTLLISITSLFFGALIGYGLFIAAYYHEGIFKRIIDTFVRIVSGIPVLILLMIFYYLIFGKVDVSGIIVAIICFSLTFAASTISILQEAIKVMDSSQDEAARSLGYTKLQALIRILLPQVFQSEYDAFRKEIIYIIQSTSVVGFIAVTDLTKVNDLIRARTYDAFFPLILIAIIYFILAYIVSKIVGMIVTALDPRKRRAEDILKGVQRND